MIKFNLLFFQSSGDNGLVSILNSMDLKDVLKMKNSIESTWSLSSKNNIFYFGDNSHIIKGKLALTTLLIFFFFFFFKIVFDFFKTESFKLIGHSNNIPCIDISDCNRYLISISIDKTIRIWNLKEKKEILKKELNEWGWSCKWIRINSIQNKFEFKLNYNSFDNIMLKDHQHQEEEDMDDEEESEEEEDVEDGEEYNVEEVTDDVEDELKIEDEDNK